MASHHQERRLVGASPGRTTDLFTRAGHVATGLRHLPAIARRLHQGRDLGEPFDFLTWFEHAPTDAAAFEDLLAALRETEEWRYVEREVTSRSTAAPARTQIA